MILVAPDSLHWSGVRYIVTADLPVAPLDAWAAERLGNGGQEGTEEPLPDLTELPNGMELLGRPDVPERIRELFSNEPKGEWSGPLWELEHRLREAGFTAAETLAVCWGSACNKYERDGRPIEDMWKEILKNYANAKAGTLAELFSVLNEYLALDDTGHVYFALAVAVSANLDGDPLWGMLAGAPSGGKTEAIRGLDYLAIHVDELTAASLLSWISKGRASNRKQEPTGILTRTGERGFVTVGDFSTVLAMSDRGSRDQLFANLRRVYDGGLTRELGNAPRALEWSGRCTFLAGCTPAIDNYTAHADQLGPRWLYYRLRPRPTEDKRKASRKKRMHEAEVESYRSKVRGWRPRSYGVRD